MGMDAYRTEREARLAVDPRTQRNWEAYVAAGRSVAEVGYLPVKLDIENVSRCNFACRMCAVSKWHKGQRARDMTLDEFKALIDEQYGLVEIKLNGLGEAMLQGDTWFEMIRYARARRIWVRVTTNGSLLHLRGNIDKLIDSDANEIDISVDGVDAPTFEGIRIQGDFDRVTRNVMLLNDAFDRRSMLPRTKMWTLVQRRNAHNLMEHVRYAASFGFRHLVFSTQLHGWGDEELAQENAATMVSLSEPECWDLVKAGEDLNLRVAFWDVADKFTLANLCPWPFERAVVTSDSRTVPCCMIGDPDAFEIGHGKSFVENWLGEEYARFRAAHLVGRIPAVCKGCYKEEEK